MPHRSAIPLPRVGRGRGVSRLYGHCELHVIDQSGESPIADALQLAIPSRDRQPDFEFDVGVRGRPGLGHNAAKCGQTLIQRGDVSPAEWRGRAVEGPRRDGLGQRIVVLGIFAAARRSHASSPKAHAERRKMNATPKLQR